MKSIRLFRERIGTSILTPTKSSPHLLYLYNVPLESLSSSSSSSSSQSLPLTFSRAAHTTTCTTTCTSPSPSPTTGTFMVTISNHHASNRNVPTTAKSEASTSRSRSQMRMKMRMMHDAYSLYNSPLDSRRPFSSWSPLSSPILSSSPSLSMSSSRHHTTTTSSTCNKINSTGSTSITITRVHLQNSKRRITTSTIDSTKHDTNRKKKDSTSTKHIHMPPATMTNNFAMDPYSKEAKQIIANCIGNGNGFDIDIGDGTDIIDSVSVSKQQHDKLTQLCHLIVEWNEKINLISRKDCTSDVVFGRHVLPSIALAALSEFQMLKEKAIISAGTGTGTGSSTSTNTNTNIFKGGLTTLIYESRHRPKIMDVGTGGGFPGLPLAIAFPDMDFLLVDSTAKKLKVIDDICTKLNISNVITHHARVEEMAIAATTTTTKTTNNNNNNGEDSSTNKNENYDRKFDICVGRSVTTIPKLCYWTKDLLKRRGGKLIYIVGGEIDDSVQSRAANDINIDDLLNYDGVSDKRAITLNRSSVLSIAKPIAKKQNDKQKHNKHTHNKEKAKNKDKSKAKVKTDASRQKTRSKNNMQNVKKKDNRGTKPEDDASEEKERDYSNFKRYQFD